MLGVPSIGILNATVGGVYRFVVPSSYSEKLAAGKPT